VPNLTLAALAAAAAAAAAAAGAAITVALALGRSEPPEVPSGRLAPRAEGASPASIVQVSLPQTFTPSELMGEQAFDAACAVCHGAIAAGIEGVAPPLVHRIYAPRHHADFAFHLAVQNGVRAHHWRFGDMPPIPGLSRAEVTLIIDYIRALQRANGIP
jgi:hypothetical protein